MRKGVNIFVVLFFAISLIANVTAFAHPETCDVDMMNASLARHDDGVPLVNPVSQTLPAPPLSHAPDSLLHCSSVVAGILAKTPGLDMRIAGEVRPFHFGHPFFEGLNTSPPLGPPKAAFS